MRPESVSDWTLERIALGELLGDELVEAHTRLAAEPGGVQRLRDLELSTAQILREHPPEIVVPRILQRIARAEARDAKGSFQRGWWAGMGAGLAAAAIALLCALLLPGEPAQRPALAPEVTRIKGLAPHVVVHRAGDRGPERLSDGARVAPGDVLQVGYVAGGEAFGAIVSIDGAGAVTLHHPEFATLAPVLEDAARVDLPFSYELDDAPEFERFLFVTSPDPIDVDAVIAAARSVATSADARFGALPLPDRLHQHSLLLDKGARP